VSELFGKVDLRVFNLELSHISSFISVIGMPLYVQHYLLHNLSIF